MIEVRNLTKIYCTKDGNAITALHNLNLDIYDDEFVAVVGKSGCGKSTFLKLIAGLLIPTSGTVTIDGKLVSTYKPDVGIVFQSALLLPWLDVLNNVLLPIDILHKRRNNHLVKAQELLNLVGLGDCVSRLPRELSSGMQQRVAICRAVIHDPKYLLMDEPFGALDAITRNDLGAELIKICSIGKKTILFITHSITEAILLSNRVIVMESHSGRIAKIIDIDLPKPRLAQMEFTKLFQSYHEEIYNLIYQHNARKEC